MADLALDPNDRDILIEDDAMSIIAGDDALVQHLVIRFQFFLAEWFLDQRLGIPYLTRILIKNPNLVAVRNIFREVILETPGIATITRFDLLVDSVIRKFSLNFTCEKTDGGVLDFSEEFLIE